jgi:hypothetical protein
MTPTEFLQKWNPAGPWNLVAIHPMTGAIQAYTYVNLDYAGDWIKKLNGTWNLYFTVNSLIEPIDNKPARANIKSMDWLHVDIDVDKNESLKDGLARIKALAPEGLPPPTVTVFSGGGYQLYWKLKEPVVINGEAERFEDAKLYNVYLESKYGGDKCHNVDRIMRLPGTMNLPTKKKLAKHPDRKPVKAECIDFNPALVYDLSRFEKGEKKGSAKPEDVEISLDNIIRIKDTDELDKWNVPQWCRSLLVQGGDPEDQTKYPSRSEALFAACCELARCKVPKEVMYGIITDPAFGISASVLDKGSRIDTYATKQIRDSYARVDEEKDPVVAEMNARYFCSKGGKDFMAYEEVFDPVMKRYFLDPWSKEGLLKRYDHVLVQAGEDKNGNPKMVNKGSYWWHNPKKKIYDRIVFSPGQEVDPNLYNLWKGFAFQPTSGGAHESYLEHVHQNICSGNDEYYRYMIGWLATTVQRPGEPAEVAVVTRGGQGTGKGIFIKSFGRLFGRHFLQVSNPKHLIGNFNSHLRDCVVLFGDEAFYAGDKQHESILKTLITEQYLLVEAKGVDAAQAHNFIHLFMASNSSWVVPAGADERRYFVLNVGEDQKQNEGYFKKILADLDNGGYSNLLHYLQNYSLSDFSVRKVPQTDALSEQKLHNLRGYDRWVADLADSGRLPEGDPELVKKTAVSIESLYQNCALVVRHANRSEFSKQLKKFGVRRPPDHNKKYYYFPSLPEFRRLVQAQLGFKLWESDESIQWEFLGDGVLG